jgi:hypothetical protein
MRKIIVITLVLEAGLFPSPALARATNPSEHPMHAVQEVDGTPASSPSDFVGRHWRRFLPN